MIDHQIVGRGAKRPIDGKDDAVGNGHDLSAATCRQIEAKMDAARSYV